MDVVGVFVGVMIFTLVIVSVGSFIGLFALLLETVVFQLFFSARRRK